MRKNALQIKFEYTKWKEDSIVSRKGFFPVYRDFAQYLSCLSPGAISLFLYFGLYSDGKTGECFHSVETIAQHFGKTTRTISNWIDELVKSGLIERIQMQLNSVTHTFLKPYPNDDFLELLRQKNGEKL